jgi:nitrous oxidase accessory protein NosD
MRRIKSLTLVLFLVVAGFFIIDFSLPDVQGATLYVGGSGGSNHSTIQEAINSADPGDTIYVFLGTYTEALVIDKTLTLVGESSHSTIIDFSGSLYGIQIFDTDYVNISGFTINGANSANLFMVNSNNSHIHENIFTNALSSALRINPGSFNKITENKFVDNLNGIIIQGTSQGNLVDSNEFEGREIGDDGRAITFQNGATDNIASRNNIHDFNQPGFGIYVYESEGNEIVGNRIADGFEAVKIDVVNEITFSNNVISGNMYGINTSSAFITIENCTIEDSISYDIWISDSDSVGPEIIFINTSFNDENVRITGSGSSLTVYYHLRVMVEDEEGMPVSGASVLITDSPSGSYSETITSDSQGYIHEVTLIAFTQTQSEKVTFMPYNITASSTNLLGWAGPEFALDEDWGFTIVMFRDSDGDSVFDKDDDFPTDATQTTDSDGDGYGDDPAGNDPDAFPQDPLEWSDSDSDGVGDNQDAFPQDPTEQNDTDSDGVGDNADAFPKDPKEQEDSDSDGVGDKTDVFPNDPDEWEDSDSDGVGDNSDFMPDFNNTIFFTLMGIIVIVIILLLLVLSARRRKRSNLPFDEEKDSE